MKFLEVLSDVFITEEKGESLLLLDVDDTLVQARNIFIYRKMPSDEQEVKLTPEEYANDPNSKIKENKKFFIYREFRDPDKVAQSIKTGLPLISNLKIMDSYIKNGWTIGILTARGMEDVVAKTMKVWLKYKNNKGELEDLGDKLVRDLIFAINDDNKKYPGTSDFEKKTNVIRELSKKYDRIMFIDDDIKNINAVNELAKKEKLKVYTKLAKK